MPLLHTDNTEGTSQNAAVIGVPLSEHLLASVRNVLALPFPHSSVYTCFVETSHAGR